MSRVVRAVGVVLLAATVIPMPSAQAVSFENVALGYVGAEGSGCPANTTGGLVAPDRSSVSVTFSEYLAVNEAGLSKDCRVRIAVTNVPAGYTYAVKEAIYGGEGQLDSGAVGRFQHRYYFAGQTPGSYIDETIDMSMNAMRPQDMLSPGDLAWYLMKPVPDNKLVWAPCGTNPDIVVDTALSVPAGSELSLDHLDVATLASEEQPDVATLAYKAC